MTNKEQIEVLEIVKAKVEKKYTSYYLCTLFRGPLDLYEPFIGDIPGLIQERIPLFTKENAQQFADPNYPMDFAWWKGHDKERRIQFLDWMIEQLELPEDNFIMNGF